MEPDPPPSPPRGPRGIKRVALLVVGWVSMGLAIAGVPLPLLPTTPFVLLAAACFLRASPGTYDKLLQSRYLGPYLEQWSRDRSVPPGAKHRAYVVVVVTFAISIALVGEWPLRVMLLVVGAVLLLFLSRLRTAPRHEPEDDSAVS